MVGGFYRTTRGKVSKSMPSVSLPAFGSTRFEFGGNSRFSPPSTSDGKTAAEDKILPKELPLPHCQQETTARTYFHRQHIRIQRRKGQATKDTTSAQSRPTKLGTRKQGSQGAVHCTHCTVLYCRRRQTVDFSSLLGSGREKHARSRLTCKPLTAGGGGNEP